LSDGRSVTLCDVLGRGELGTVYRGLLESGWGVRRPVAVKLLSLRADLDDSEATCQLGRIARRAVCVRDPSVIQLFELNRTVAQLGEPVSPVTIMELVDGPSLASLIEDRSSDRSRMPIDFAMVVTVRAAEALGAALFTDGADGSLTNLVHGDLSPRQILVSTQGEVKVGDFGQFTFREVSSGTRSRSRLAYTAPEVACGAAPNARSDVFSLGIILRELLVGPRFAPRTSMAEAARMVRDGAMHSDVLEPSLPQSLRDVIQRATQPDAMGRYPHARAMAFDLRREMLRLGLCDAQTCIRHALSHRGSRTTRSGRSDIATSGSDRGVRWSVTR
jgi:serine/threonine-protein kinase